jgi:hypothetical protein
MFRRVSERLHESMDGRWQLRAEHTLAGIVVPTSPWSLWEKRGDAFVQVVSAPTMAMLADAVRDATQGSTPYGKGFSATKAEW